MKTYKAEIYRKDEQRLFESYKIVREEHFIKINKWQIKIRVQATGNGKPIIFIHGGPNAEQHGQNSYRCCKIINAY